MASFHFADLEPLAASLYLGRSLLSKTDSAKDPDSSLPCDGVSCSF